MGYTLKAYIGKDKNLNPILKKFKKSQKVHLNGGFSMVLMTEELYDEINEIKFSSDISTFQLLTENIEQKIIKLIGNQELAYVESDFFGGQGGHIGVIWCNGKREFLTEFDKSSMNKILKRLGVKRTLFKDEFEKVGLAKNRHVEDWIK